jgi:TetR/AcrR family transcriptional regulator, regulator of cefoperazone and chloramphenicol sensitivity
VSIKDLETRDRLLAAAYRLFAERGFAKVTVRDICRRARANVAAVNYHFHGKTGLYEEVLRSAIRTMRGTTEAAQSAGANRSPAQQLETFIAIFLQKVVEGRNSWIHQLMMHELSDPTPALDLVVDDVLRPRMAYLSGIIASLIGCAEDDPRVGRCLMSVQAQIHALLVKNPIADRLVPDRRPVTADGVSAIAHHITRFSLAGIQAMAENRRPSRSLVRA